MSDQGISIADIGAARNQKLAAEQNTREETDRVAQELEGAHQDALALKEKLRQQEGDSAVPQQQAFPHGSMASSEPKDQASLGEKVAEGIASTDQGVTTAARDAVHSVSETVTAAGTAAANAAGAAVDKVKEGVQSTLGARAANAGGGITAGYEGAVFSSDDPDYKDKSGTQPTIASPHEEICFRGLASLLGGRSPIIASPKEQVAPGPASLGEGSVGIAAGDPKGGANIVAATHVASKGIVSSLKEAFTPTVMTAGAPAGPSDPDPRTAKVPVGDFRALHEALGIATQEGSHVGHGHHSSSSGNADVSMGTTDHDNAAAMPSAQDVKEGWEGVKAQAQEGVQSAADRVQQGLESASERVQGAVGADSTSSTGTGAAGGGILGGLASIVSGIATKVNLANSSEELMAGGAVPDAAAGPAAADGPTAHVAPEATAASDAAKDAAAKVRDAMTPDSSSSSGGSGSVTESVKQGAQEVVDKTAYGAGAVTGAVVGAGERVADTAASVRDSAAHTLGMAGDKVHEAKQSAEDMAAAAKDKTAAAAASARDSTAYGAGAVSGGVMGAGERAADAAASARDSAAHTLGMAGSKVDEAKQSAADTAAEAKSSAAAAAGTAEDMAAAAKDKTVDAAASARDSTAHALGLAGGKADAAKDSVDDAAASARDSAAEAMAAAGDKVSGAAEQAKASAGGGLSSLIQGAKEGFVGAYDAAASVLVGDEKHPHTHPATAGGDSSGPPAAAHPPSNVAGDSGLQSGAVGSGHASAPQAGIGSVLKQGWEDLKHGGAKAPHAVSTGGETSASHDVTSNIERSKHLDNDQQAKIYKAETYAVSPGSQATSDQAGTDASKSGVVVGDKRPVTGAKPHGIPDSSKVHADQATRFDGNKGMGTGFGTGSAAPWSGDTSIKSVSALFSNTHSSLDMGGLNTQEQQALVEAAAQAGVSADRVDSTSEGGVRGWVSSMSAVWRHLGVASAKGPGGEGGPSTKELKDNIQWDNPTQDAVIDPVRGVTKKEGHSPGHKIQMRTSEQIPPETDPSDSQFFKDKAERLGKVVKDTVTTSSEEAAADPNNLKGKSSDNKPDGLAHYTKHEAGVAAEKLSHTPEAAASAVGTAGEIVSGMAGHVVDKAKELGHNITQHGDFLNPEERAAKSKAAVERAEKQMEKMGDIATDHNAVQALQEERMANIGNPAHKRETLGDKIIGPMVSDASDDTNARKLAASYKEWQHDKEAGAPGGQPSGAAGSGSSGDVSMGDAARGLGPEAADTARSAKDVVKMEGQAAGEGVQSAADKAGSKVGGAVDSVKGLANEAADTARATGEVISMEVSEAADAVQGKTDQAASRASDTARDIKHSAQDTARDVKHSAQDTARDVKHSAQDTAQRTADSARSTADRASAATQDAANRTGDSARDAGRAAADAANRAYGSVADVANRAGESVKEGAAAVGDKVQQGVDAVAEGTGYVAGAGGEKMSEAQEAAARAGEKVGATAGGVLSSVGDAAKGLLGALMGPFEREAAFDESTAALTGPPKTFEVVGAEQVSGTDISSTQAPAVKRAPTTTSTAAAPAGADTDELRAKAAGTLQDTKEGIKARVQAGIDDTARAAGLTAGHIESAVEAAQQQVNQQLAAVQDKVAAVTDNIHVPPAEIPANTEDLLRQRQQLQQ